MGADPTSRSADRSLTDAPLLDPPTDGHARQEWLAVHDEVLQALIGRRYLILAANGDATEVERQIAHVRALLNDVVASS